METAGRCTIAIAASSAMTMIAMRVIKNTAATSRTVLL